MRSFVMTGLAVSMVSLAGLAQPAQAALLIDTGPANGFADRVAEYGIATRFTVDHKTSLSAIAVSVDLDTAGKLKFFVFNSVTAALLFSSGEKSFADDGQSYKQSDSIPFVLLPGITYAIGATANVSATFAYNFPGGTTVSGVNSLGGNQNASGGFTSVFALDTFHNNTDGLVQLYGVVLPEPASLLLLGAGLLGLGALRRRA